MRARLATAPGMFERLFSRFQPGRWYAAEWQDDARRAVVLREGRASRTVAAAQVQLRTAADDEWEVQAVARVSQEKGGQAVDYPARTAECPHGHRRRIPTRFSGDEVMLTCRECGEGYRLRAP